MDYNHTINAGQKIIIQESKTENKNLLLNETIYAYCQNIILLPQGISRVVVSLLTFSNTLAVQWLRNGAFSASAAFCQDCSNKSLPFTLSTLPISATFCSAFITLVCSFVIGTLGCKHSFLLGSFIFVLILCVINFLLILPLNLSLLQVSQKRKVPLIECLKESLILATSSCALGFALMTLVMNAIPLPMNAAHSSTIDSKMS